MKDEQTRERFIDLRAKGWSYSRIAKELKTSKQTLINWSKELSLEISNLRTVELEALQEKYYLLKEKRIELFGDKLKAVKKELGLKKTSQAQDVAAVAAFSYVKSFDDGSEKGAVFKD